MLSILKIPCGVSWRCKVRQDMMMLQYVMKRVQQWQNRWICDLRTQWSGPGTLSYLWVWIMVTLTIAIWCRLSRLDDLAVIAALLQREQQERQRDHRQLLDTLRGLLATMDLPWSYCNENTASTLIECEMLSQNNTSRLDPEIIQPCSKEGMGVWNWFKHMLCLV